MNTYFKSAYNAKIQQMVPNVQLELWAVMVDELQQEAEQFRGIPKDELRQKRIYLRTLAKTKISEHLAMHKSNYPTAILADSVMAAVDDIIVALEG